MSGRYTQISRLFRVLRLLSEAPDGLTVSEIHTRISETFKVEKRSVYRDLEALDASGFPVFEENLSEDGRSIRWKISRKLKIDKMVFSGDATTDVKLRFSNAASSGIRSTRLHPSQKIILHEDGATTLELKVELSAELVGWVLSFGPEVRVLGPAHLKEDVASAAKQICEQYESQIGPTMGRIK